MSWNTLATGGDIVKLGEGEGQVREVTGVFTGVRSGEHGPLYDFEGEGGKQFSVPHNKALEALDPEKYAGSLVQLEYQGTKPLKGGKTFKQIAIRQYDGPITEEMAAKYPSLEVTPAEEEGDGKPLPF